METGLHAEHVETRTIRRVSSDDDSAKNDQPGGVRCAQCGSANRADRKFCGHCGGLLFEPCIHCSAEAACDETFCGACGTNRLEALRQRIAQLEEELEGAARLALACDYKAALARLTAVAGSMHPRLVELAEEARRQMAVLETTRQVRTQEAYQALHAAQRHATAFDFDQARCALEAVPPGLRGHEHNLLLKRVQQQSDEIAALNLGVRRQVQARRFHEALAGIRRLLELKPNHSDAQSLLNKLQAACNRDEIVQRDRLCRTARESIEACSYGKAVGLLERVPPGAADEEVDKLLEQARELAWLSRVLRESPWIDAALPAVAERLSALQPRDEQARKLQAEMRRRMEVGDRQGSLSPPPWARHRQSHYLGYPVSWMELCRIEARDPQVRLALREHPGRFFTAIGLALQGVGQARLALDLMPREKAGMLKRWASRPRKPAATAWGLDLGSSGIKAARVSLEASGRASVDGCLLIEHARPLSRAADRQEQAALVEASLQKLLARLDGPAGRICLGVPSGKVLTRTCSLPPLAEVKLDDAARIEAAHQFPLPLESLVWDYWLLAAAGGGPQRAILAAAQRSELERHLEAFQKLKIEVDHVQSDFVALYNLLAYEHPQWAGPFEPSQHEPDGEPPRGRAVALVDVGCAATQVIVAGPATAWSRTIGHGSEAFTGALVKTLRLTSQRAELIKRRPEMARRLSNLYQAYEPPLEQLVAQIQRSLESFSHEHRDCPIERVHFTGGGCQMHGLLRYLVAGP